MEMTVSTATVSVPSIWMFWYVSACQMFLMCRCLSDWELDVILNIPIERLQQRIALLRERFNHYEMKLKKQTNALWNSLRIHTKVMNKRRSFFESFQFGWNDWRFRCRLFLIQVDAPPLINTNQMLRETSVKYIEFQLHCWLNGVGFQVYASVLNFKPWLIKKKQLSLKNKQQPFHIRTWNSFSHFVFQHITINNL